MGTQLKVLVVDPDSESRDALRRAFPDAGGQVRSVGSALEAGRHLSEFLPDVVVVALDLPAADVESLLAEGGRFPPRGLLSSRRISGAAGKSGSAARRLD